MKKAAIDIGSHAVLFTAMKYFARRMPKVLIDDNETTNLGDALNTEGLLQGENVDLTLKAIEDFSNLARTMQIDELVIFGTATLRNARNAADFIAEVQTRTKQKVRILSGEEEAQLLFYGTRHAKGIAPDAIFDIGGGSTEIIIGNEEGIELAESFDIGAIFLTKRFKINGKMTYKQFQSINDYIVKHFLPIKNAYRHTLENVVITGGSASTIAAVIKGLEAYEPDLIEGTRINREILWELYAELNSLSVREKREVIGMDLGRVHTIVTGLAILIALARLFGIKTLIISNRGVRFGILEEQE
jgi:exopolyphosphatase/guanosine-5'-triphosphate,3'-diphosphate pyrophosphatase